MLLLNPDFKKTLTGIIFGALFFGALIFLPEIYFSATLAVIALICAYEFCRLFPFNKFLLFFILPIYPLLSFFLMILMSQSGRKFELFLLFISVFAFDTGAYFFGKILGKHKISRISPNKTWEGFFGGLLTTFLILIISIPIYFNSGYLLNNLFTRPDVIWNLFQDPQPYTFFFSIFLSVFTCTIAQIGDFFESWFKRKASIKDSGALLPGHGGFLDRFDGVIFVTPFIYLFCLA